MQDFFNLASSLGFPVAVASYLLFRLEKKIEKSEESSRKLEASCQEMIKKFDNLEKVVLNRTRRSVNE